jgi:hypothetical protein
MFIGKKKSSENHQAVISPTSPDKSSAGEKSSVF